MSCIAAPELSIGDVPGLSLLLGTPSLLPSLPGPPELCCKLPLTIPDIPIPLGSILAALNTALGGSTVDTILLALNTAEQTLNALLDELSFSCPLD